MPALYPLVAPATEPLLLSEVRAQLQLDSGFTDDDPLLKVYIAASRKFAEEYTGRQFVECKYQMFLDGFPGSTKYQGGPQPYTEEDLIRPPHVPFLSMSSIVYVNTAGTSTTLSSSDYVVDAYSEPARISPAYAETWPVTRCQLNAVTVTYFAGHLCSFTANATTDVLTTSGKNFTTGEKVRLSVSEGGTLPGGLALETDYYVVGASSSTLQLAATSGGSAINLTDTGSGTLYLGEVPRLAKEAMLLCVAHWYRRRGDDEMKDLMSDIPPMAKGLLSQLWDGTMR